MVISPDSPSNQPQNSDHQCKFTITGYLQLIKGPEEGPGEGPGEGPQREFPYIHINTSFFFTGKEV